MRDANIQLLSRKTDAAARWKEQYFQGGRWKTLSEGGSEEIYNAILAAEDDPDKIDIAIGNDGWTKNFCDACSSHFVVGVNMLEPDYETTPTFCADCIKKAYELCFGPQ